jgi:cytochrome c biogenesis protein CcmG/thiol:disulfide interchange protein DsbE
MNKWRFILPAGIFAALAAFLYVGLYLRAGDIPSPLIGKPAPAFSLPSAQYPDRQVSSADFAGKPYVLNVWATWCAGCRQEHDALLAIARSSPVPLVGLAWKDERSLIQQWLDQLGNPYTAVAFDPEGRVAIDGGVYGAPETFLVGPDGRVLYKHIAPMTMETWQKEFLPRIAAAARSGTS